MQETKELWWRLIFTHKALAGVYLLRQHELPQECLQTGQKCFRKGQMMGGGF